VVDGFISRLWWFQQYFVTCHAENLASDVMKNLKKIGISGNIPLNHVESPFVVSMFLLLLFVPLGWQHFHEALHAIWNGIRLVNLITHAFIKKTRYPKFSNISTICSTGFFSLSPFCHLATFARYSFGLGYGLSMTANAGLAPLVAKLEKRTM